VKKLTLSAFALLLPSLAIAQTVPAIQNISYAPGSYAPLAGYPHSQSQMPYRAPRIVEEPIPVSVRGATPAGAVVHADRSVLFNYGENLPSIVCAPLHVCEVSLQPGETIQSLEVGDTTRWSVKLARVTSEGQETTHLVVKPSETGIVSNLVAITDKRSYSIQLVSRKDRAWMPKIAFTYPDDQQANWKAYFAENETRQNTVQVASNTASSALPAQPLNFQYKIHGKAAWKPVRVYSDASKTYIQLPATAQNDEIPVLLDLGRGDTKQLVNYRLDGNTFIVDKVLKRAALVSGIGKSEEKVTIAQEGTP
jgi:P-type conjugative transfer protein TrbG